MTWKSRRVFGLALCLLGGTALAQSPSNSSPYSTQMNSAVPSIMRVQDTAPDASSPASDAGGAAPGSSPSAPEGLPQTNPAEEGGFGPTPLPKVNILQDLIFGKDNKDAPFIVRGWLDGDYTYRSTGKGQNNIAPIQNRFGDEFLARELGLWIYKPLDTKELSWGFNSIFLAGSDASFNTPTAGGWRNTNFASGRSLPT